MLKFIILLLFFLAGNSFNTLALASGNKNERFHGVYAGMNETRFLKFYPWDQVRSYRQEGLDRWVSFNEPFKGQTKDVVTFYFQNDKVNSWKVNDRPEIIKEYLREFSSLQGFPLIHTAISNVLFKMPYKDFLYVTNRKRPIILTEYYDSGTARFASSQEFIVFENDPPCCSEGFTLIKLGLGLGAAKTPEAIEGIVAHEIAHRVLEHIKKGNVNCDAERAANRLIKQWGFTKEFEEAKKLFGTRHGDPAGCQEAPAKSKN